MKGTLTYSNNGRLRGVAAVKKQISSNRGLKTFPGGCEGCVQLYYI